MSEADALTADWRLIDASGTRSEIKGLKSIRLATVDEFRAFFGYEPEDPRDIWHVSFWMQLEDGVKQHPDTILIQVDARTGVADFYYQM